jgi:hypothetical protein
MKIQCTLYVVYQALPGRPLVPNFNSLTLQQRQALLAAHQQQQRLLAESNRQLIARSGAVAVMPTVTPPGAGMPVSARVAFTSNGPTALLPTLRGPLPRAALATAASGLPASVAALGSSASTSHKAEKRKYDSLRSVTIFDYKVEVI